jgi:hypothetical protein
MTNAITTALRKAERAADLLEVQACGKTYHALNGDHHAELDADRIARAEEVARDLQKALKSLRRLIDAEEERASVERKDTLDRLMEVNCG